MWRMSSGFGTSTIIGEHVCMHTIYFLFVYVYMRILICIHMYTSFFDVPQVYMCL